MDCSPPGFPVHGILQARTVEWVAIPSPGDLPNPGIKPESPTLPADSLPSEPPGKLSSSSCCCSLTESCPTLKSHGLQRSQASLSFTISQRLLKLMSIKSVMPSNYLIFCHPLLLLPSILPSIRLFSNESALCIRWPKYWSFSFSISPSNEYSGLISLWIVSCCPRDSQESSPAPQFESINSSVLSFLYSPTLTTVHDYWKDYSFNYMDLYWQSDVSAFQYTMFMMFPSKEQASFNFMPAVTICSDLGTQLNKVCHCFHFLPFYLP